MREDDQDRLRLEREAARFARYAEERGEDAPGEIKVEFVNLKQRADLNGTVAILVRELPELGKWLVQTSDGKQFRVGAGHFRRLDAEDEPEARGDPRHGGQAPRAQHQTRQTRWICRQTPQNDRLMGVARAQSRPQGLLRTAMRNPPRGAALGGQTQKLRKRQGSSWSKPETRAGGRPTLAWVLWTCCT